MCTYEPSRAFENVVILSNHLLLFCTLNLHKGTKRRREDGTTLLGETTDSVDEDSIIGWQKKIKADKDERMGSIYEGREVFDDLSLFYGIISL